MGYKLSWGVVGMGGPLLMAKAALSQGLSQVLILHALLILQTQWYRKGRFDG